MDINWYLVFHVIVETFSIVVCVSIFMFAWNTRKLIENDYFLFLGVAFVFVAFLDLAHMLAYKGMGILPGQSSNYSTQLWIAARYLQSISLLFAPLIMHRKINYGYIFSIYGVVDFLCLLSILNLKIFPDCYTEGVGLTLFKHVSEYLISLLMLASMILLVKNQKYFDRAILLNLCFSISAGITSELMFSDYVNVYGSANAIGHVLKVVSFYFFYRAIIEIGLKKPYNLLFRDLKQSENALREERDKIQSYLKVVEVIIIAIDVNEKVVLINRKGCEILGYDGNEIMGKNWFEYFLPPETRNRMREVFIKLISGKAPHLENFVNPVVTKDNSITSIEWRSGVLLDESGQIKAVLYSGEDITEREELQNKINKLRREYEAFMRHELKNMVAPIRGYSDLLLQFAKGSLNEQQLDFLVKIKLNTDTILNLIDSLKKLQDFEIGNYELETVQYDLKSLIEEVADDLQLAATEHNVKIAFDNTASLSTIRLDQNLMKGVFNNLIKNAVEHVSDLTDKLQKTVTVRMFNENNKLIVKINNRGDIIPPERLELFFEKFNSDRIRKKDGTGLGTTYAYLVTKAHGGEIFVESNEIDGTTVTLEYSLTQ